MSLDLDHRDDDRARRAEEARQRRQAELDAQAEAERAALETRLPDAGALDAMAARWAADGRRRTRRGALAFALLVLLPAIALALGAQMLLPPRYDAEAQFSILVSGGTVDASNRAILSREDLSPSAQAAQLVRAYILSAEMMALLADDATAAPSAGPLAGLLARLDPRSDLQRHRDRVRVKVDIQSGLSTLTIEGLSPLAAEAAAEHVLDAARDRIEAEARSINRTRIARLEQVERRAAAAEAESVARLRALQRQTGDVDPRERARLTYGYLAELEAARDRLGRSSHASWTEGGLSPATLGDLEQADLLDAQIARAEAALAGSPDMTGSTGARILAFDTAEARLAAARDARRAAGTALQAARTSIALDPTVLRILAPPFAGNAPAAPAPFRIFLLATALLATVFAVLHLLKRSLSHHGSY
ncbi:hypothetical protein [Oceanomicrobium pacificus]|uniref:Capsule biosynthesis protein n=1 Tax=Oceanomicrobium pacificus TaxID=2692916 RepID=A0A6B0TN72_9RHOB|nr:hypothetical protein [Oceanomicrobium pacificus]MXU65987.1 hypothetical protein [Oceanomicrobium pacificus]